MTGGWRGRPGPYTAILPGSGGGGGLRTSLLRPGQTTVIAPGFAGGGGTRQGTAAPLAGFGGCGGPGPGMLIGVTQ